MVCSEFYSALTLPKGPIKRTNLPSQYGHSHTLPSTVLSQVTEPGSDVDSGVAVNVSPR